MSSYDVIIIGAGMSGLAAAARLSLFDKKILILEKHIIPGGLNSYYQRRNKDQGGIRQFDVGLHALTNFVKKGEKGKPFTKLLKQLRLRYEDFALKEQTHSLISFPDRELKFTNDFEMLRAEVHEKFPHEKDNFEKLIKIISEFDELNLNQTYQSSKEKLKTILHDSMLLEMLLCPLLIYGSAWEDDMDFSQFVIMFKALYFEGFSRPEGGVRRIIDLLMKTLKERNVEIKFKKSVKKIIKENNKAVGIETFEGETYFAKTILSSIGYPETMKCIDGENINPRTGQMTFLESIMVFDKKIPKSSQEATIVFYNNRPEYKYQRANNFFDKESAVICFPDHYEFEKLEGEGTARVTYISQYPIWKNLPLDQYQEKKEEVFQSGFELVKKFSPNFDGKLLFQDTFTPLTIEKFTSHINGTVYGSIDKTRDGKTPINNLYIIGTDQGFLGIVGSMLSGISMSNLHVLMNEGA